MTKGERAKARRQRRFYGFTQIRETSDNLRASLFKILFFIFSFLRSQSKNPKKSCIFAAVFSQSAVAAFFYSLHAKNKEKK
jgi:hypothetical protein